MLFLLYAIIVISGCVSFKDRNLSKLHSSPLKDA